MLSRVIVLVLFAQMLAPIGLSAAEKMVGIHSARVMSQSYPWIAEEAGLFKKYNIDFQLVFIASSGIVTAALLGGDADMTLTGGVGNVRAYVQGSTDVVFIGGVKNTMTQTLVAGGNIKKPEDVKGKKIGVSRIGSNTHYFSIQAMRRFNMEPGRDFSFVQTGGDPETFAALLGGGIDVACLTPPNGCRRPRSGLPLCGLWPGSENSLCRHGVRHQAVRARQAQSGGRPVHAGNGRGFQDRSYRSRIRL